MTSPPPPHPGGSGQQGNSAATPAPSEPAQPPQQTPTWYGNQRTGVAQQGQQEPVFPQPGAPVPSLNPQQPQFPPSPHRNGAETPWDQRSFAESVAPDPKKRRWPWFAGGAVVVLAAGAGASSFLLPGAPGDPTPVAQDVVAKVNASDFEGVKERLCAAKRPELSSQLDQLKPGTAQVRMTGVATRGDSATADLAGSFTLHGARLPVQQSIQLVVEDGEWKVCSLDQ